MDVVNEAIRLAIKHHAGQVNKHDGEPYLLHPHRVAYAAEMRGYSKHHVAVAWLHDALEDTDLTLDTLLHTFGHDDLAVVQAVSALTKTKGVDLESYYNAVLTCPVAAAIKVLDIQDNFSRNHLIGDESTRARMAKKYSLGLDILKEYR